MEKKRKRKKQTRKLSNAQIARSLKRAKRVEPIEKVKTKRDKTFRTRAENTGLTPSISLNAEIREKVQKRKATRGQIKAQENRIKDIQRTNKKIRERRADLELEYPFVDEKRKKEIERLLNSAEYKERDLFTQRNVLKQMRGQNFDFIVDDGFKKYKINSSELKKYWKRGGDASLPILKRMQKNNNEAIRHYKKLINEKKKTASRAEMKKLRRILNGLENKLAFTIEKNIQALETGDSSHLDEISENGEKAYSILNRIVGFNIDRVGI